MKFIEKIKSLREADGLTQRQLSASLGIDAVREQTYTAAMQMLFEQLKG